MKKKLLALLLAGAMVMGLSVTAMAAEATNHFANKELQGITLKAQQNVPYSDKNDVTVKVNPNNPGAVYYVIVEWDNLEFTYNFGDAPEWDPLTHQYTSNNATGWGTTAESRDRNIKVTNHSNREMNVTASFAENSSILQKTVNNVTAKLNNASITLATGEGLAFGDASNSTFTVTINDTVPNTTSNFNLGTVYLNISDATTVTP